METDPYSYRRRLLGLVFTLLLTPFFSTAGSFDVRMETAVDYIVEMADEEVKERLLLLDQSLLEHRFDASVRNLIAYHLRYPRQTATNIGRAIAYFPIFEQELEAAGLPATLKYLPIVESALRPRALSRVGAEGLWQFMPETAPEYGLRIDDWVDERLDAVKATQAAIRYLQDAYDYLGDWSLAIAAYNAGKGGVARAKRRSGRNNFWGVQKFLPRETKNYVPALIAAIYLTEFYAEHDIEPLFPSLDEQLVAPILVEAPLSFYRIAQITGLSIDYIQRWNPGYKKGYLPAYEGGHYLLLPQRVLPALQTYLAQYGKESEEPLLPWSKVRELPAYTPQDDAHYARYSTFAIAGDSLAGIAETLRIPASQLAIWNQISPLDTLQDGAEIAYFRPTVYTELPQRTYQVAQWAAPTMALEAIGRPQREETAVCVPHFIHIRPVISLTQRAKPSEIAAWFPSVATDDILTLNSLSEDKPLAAGSIIYLPKE
ncbi:MAG: transglycosylase SLT domain-containing protein [Saprospiraceae bacterium]